MGRESRTFWTACWPISSGPHLQAIELLVLISKVELRVPAFRDFSGVIPGKGARNGIEIKFCGMRSLEPVPYPEALRPRSEAASSRPIRHRPASGRSQGARENEGRGDTGPNEWVP